MQTEQHASIITQEHRIQSLKLEREVIVDIYYPASIDHLQGLSLLLINDGQNLRSKPASPGEQHMDFAEILDELYSSGSISPIFCAAIHAGEDRRNEYGTSGILDYKGRGTKADAYAAFIFEELLPYLANTFGAHIFTDISFCGFSLGGLSAFDIVWTNPGMFRKAGLFSASLWWRTVNQDEPHFDENIHRIMHMKVREGKYYPWLKFFFETGILDETADRNNNGIIDSIDDTRSLIEELANKGYEEGKNIMYLEIEDGRHDVKTWGRAMPVFLKWGWGRGVE